MFVVKAYKILVDKGGKTYPVDRKVIKRIKRTDMKGKGYDIGDVDFWGRQLANMKTESGKLIPLCDRYGQRFAYEVMIQGTLSEWMRPYFPEHINERRGSVCVFPAYDENNVRIAMNNSFIDKYRR